MEEIIDQMGLQFRNLIQHSDGRFSCRLMHEFKGRDEFWGTTPTEALEEALNYLNQFEE